MYVLVAIFDITHTLSLAFSLPTSTAKMSKKKIIHHSRTEFWGSCRRSNQTENPAEKKVSLKSPTFKYPELKVIDGLRSGSPA